MTEYSDALRTANLYSGYTRQNMSNPVDNRSQENRKAHLQVAGRVGKTNIIGTIPQRFRYQSRILVTVQHRNGFRLKLSGKFG